MTKKTSIHAVELENPGEDVIAPVTVGNPTSAADLAVDQAHMEEFTRDEEGPAEIACARPPKGTYFAVYLETTKLWVNRRFYFMLELPNRDPYLVAGPIAKLKKDEGEDTIRPVLIVRYVTMRGDEGLWALKLDPPDGRSNPWNKTAKKALAAADEGKWVRLYSGNGHYTHGVSGRTFAQKPPVFSDRTFDELINSAFPTDRIVLDGDHEIWDELENGSDK